MRQRAMLVGYAGQHVQHMRKALVQMNLQLQYVVEDITGATGMRIIRAILSGERDPHRLAALRDERCKSSAVTIAKALQGDWRQEHLFALAQAVELVEAYQAKVAACDERIQAHLQTFTDRSDGQPLPKGPPPRADRHDLSFDATAELYRMTGMDLTAINGLAPNNRVSGGKVLSRRTARNANRAAAALRVGAQALHHSKSALGAFLRRKAAQLGMPKAITATAYKLARIIYAMLTEGTEFIERGQDYYERAYQA